MPNPKGHPETLKPFTGKWNKGETKVIRVPKALSAEVLAHARALDSGAVDTGQQADSDDIVKRLLQVVDGLEVVHGFPRNNFNTARKIFLQGLIDELRDIAADVVAAGQPSGSTQD